MELRLCMQQATTSVAGGKIFPTNKISESMRDLSFPVRILHIVCGPLATQHAAGTKVLLSKK